MTALIPLLQVVGSPHFVSSDDGQAVHDQIAQHLHGHTSVAISFKGAEDVTSAFLNAAFGQLYGEFAEEEIRESVVVQDAEPEHLALLKRVVDRAKEFFRDPSEYNAVVSGVLGE